MSDYQAQLGGATRRLDDLSAFNITRTPGPQAESPAPLWFTTPAGLAYLEALQRGDTALALHIWDAAYGRALDDWINVLWQAPWPAKEEAR